MNAPQVECIFCDDVRVEQSGKAMLIGCYGTHMLVPSLPFKVEALCASIKVRIPVKMRIKGGLSIGVTLNGQYMEDVPPAMAPVEEIIQNFKKGAAQKSAADPGEITEVVFGITMTLKNLPVERPSVLQVKAVLNAKEYFGCKLRIVQSPKAAAESTSSEIVGATPARLTIKKSKAKKSK